MKLARILAFALFAALPCFAADQYDGLITLTNLPAQGNTISAAGQTRTWTTNNPSSLQMKVTNSIPRATTNFWLAIANTPWPSNIIAQLVSSNSIRLSAQSGASLTIAITGGWARVTITTNTSSTAYTYRTPLTAEPSPVFRTNQANRLMGDLNTFATVKLDNDNLADPALTNGHAAGGVLSGTLPNPGINASVTQGFVKAEVTNGVSAKVTLLNLASNTLNLARIALENNTNTLNLARIATEANSNTLNLARIALGAATNNLQTTKLPNSGTNGYWRSGDSGDGSGLSGVVASATNAVTTYNTTNAPAGVGHISGVNIYVGTNTASAGGVQPGARIYHNTTQSLSSGADTVLVYNSERWDTDTIHDTGSNTDRMTCKTAGKYHLGACNGIDVSATGYRQTYFRVISGGGATTNIVGVDTRTATTVATFMSIACEVNLAVNDYVQVLASQNSGGPLDVLSSSQYSPEAWMQKVSD